MKMRRQNHSRRKYAGFSIIEALKKSTGFSMIEIPVALTILTVGLIALMGVLPANYQSLSQSKDVLSGVQLARYQLEQVESQSFDAASLTTAQTLYAVNSVDNGVSSHGYYYYQVSVSPRLQNCGSSPYAACTSASPCHSCTGQDDAARLAAAASKDIEVFVYQRYNTARQTRLDARMSR